MKQVVASQIVEIPDNVKLEVKARKVRVKGTRGARSPGLLYTGLTEEKYVYLLLYLDAKSPESSLTLSLKLSVTLSCRCPDTGLQAPGSRHVHLRGR